MCNGSIDASQSKDCNRVDDTCFICQSNGTSLDCKQCSRNGVNGNSFRATCVMEKDRVEAKEKSGRCQLSRFNCVCVLCGVKDANLGAREYPCTQPK